MVKLNVKLLDILLKKFLYFDVAEKDYLLWKK